MSPLYCFEIEEETGKIKRIVIENYRERHHSMYMPNKITYCYSVNNAIHEVRGDNIDKFVNWKVHSFNDDIENARQIVLANLRTRYKQAISDTKRYATVIDKLGGFGDEKDRDILSV